MVLSPSATHNHSWERTSTVDGFKPAHLGSGILANATANGSSIFFITCSRKKLQCNERERLFLDLLPIPLLNAFAHQPFSFWVSFLRVMLLFRLLIYLVCLFASKTPVNVLWVGCVVRGDFVCVWRIQTQSSRSAFSNGLLKMLTCPGFDTSWTLIFCRNR